MSHHHDHYDGQEPIDHSHGDGHDHGHDHDHSDDITPALQNLLYEQVDFSALTCLNESEPRSGAAICQKTWMQRMDNAPELQSDADEQLLMHVPFAGQVKLHSILIRTGQDDSAPSTLKLYANKDDLDFSGASELSPTQTIELAQSSEVQEYPVKRVLFNSTRSLTLFFEDNWSHGDEDVTKISYIGFKGEFMKLSKEPINFLYEAAANPADHKIKGTDTLRAGHHIGG